MERLVARLKRRNLFNKWYCITGYSYYRKEPWLLLHTQKLIQNELYIYDSIAKIIELLEENLEGFFWFGGNQRLLVS